MKKKISKLLGVGLAVILISSLFGFAAPVSAASLPTINAWTQFKYPAEGATGGWFWDPDIRELGPMAKAINGDIYVYARVANEATAGKYHKILRSTNGGRSWTDSTSALRYGNIDVDPVTAGLQSPGVVVDMVCSSMYEDVLYVTDGNYVYKSSDNATTWTIVGKADLEKMIMGACGIVVTGLPITCLDVGYDVGNKPYIFIGVKWTAAPSAGDILWIDELAIGATWLSLDLSCYDPDAPYLAAIYTPYAVAVTPDFATAPVKLMVVVTTLDTDGPAADKDGVGGAASDPETHVISSNLGVCGWAKVAELVKDCNAAIGLNHFQIDHSSRIAFPNDYVDARVLFVGVSSISDRDTTNHTEGGDVYSVATYPTGVATDLNVAGSLGGCVGKVEGTNICGITLCGDTADAAVMAGAMNTNGLVASTTWLNQPNDVFTSIDGGWTWATSKKDPTGSIHPIAVPTTSETWVQWIGDDCGASALAATRRCDCAISITCGPDIGAYWNQASLINTCFTCVLYGDHSPGYYDAGVSDTMFLLTGCADACTRPGSEPCYSVFRYVGDPTKAATSTPEHPWERVFSSMLYAAEIDTSGDPINMLMVSPDFLTTGAVFIGNSGFEIWRSLDAGCSWFKFAYPCAPRPTASAAIVVDKETVVVGGQTVAGATTVWKTTRHGTRPFTAATIAPATTASTWPQWFDFDGNNFLMGDSLSQVFISADGALTWKQVNADLEGDANATGFGTSVAFDPGYAVSGDPGENVIYASAGTKIYRCTIDTTLAMSLQTWSTIYTDADANFWGMVTTGDTVLYVGDRAASDWASATSPGEDGGMVRCLNATATAPEFEHVNFGLAASQTLTGLLLTSGVNGCPNSNVLWAADICGSGARVWFFEDTLARQLDLDSPSDGAEGLSAIIGTDFAVLTWEAACGASCYEVKVWYYCPGCLVPTTIDWQCFSCSTLAPCVGCSGETCCKVIGPLEPGVTYYWKVRVGGDFGACAYPTSLGCPMLSKWSDTWKFTTAMVTPVRCSPICGAEDITLTPNFSWSEIPGATSYEIEVSLDEDFDTLLASGTPIINAWDGIPMLEYGTTYYWRVRSLRDGAVSAWTYCLFSTEETPPEAPAPVWVCPQCGLTFTSEAALLAHIDAEHAPPATPVYIWIIIGIGAALVIAVLVLIATTRRAA
jgi:hypothetical protein